MSNILVLFLLSRNHLPDHPQLNVSTVFLYVEFIREIITGSRKAPTAVVGEGMRQHLRDQSQKQPVIYSL